MKIGPASLGGKHPAIQWPVGAAAAIVVAYLGVGAAVAGEDSRHDFALLPSVDTLNTFSESDSAIEDSDIRLTADFFYSYSGDRLRILSEYLWSSEESELERLKAGWEFSDRSIAWAGRYHSIVSYWMSEYHHGQYLQTSITRPSVETWEDDGGPLLAHIAGAYLDHRVEMPGGATWSFSTGLGLAPKLVDSMLEPFDLLDPESGHGMSASFRAIYRPDVLSDLQVGFSTAWSSIEIEGMPTGSLDGVADIDQLVLAAFADWRWGNVRLIADVVYFNHDLDRFDGGEMTDDFTLGYLQGEYRWTENWTVFGRGDFSLGADSSPYLSRQPDYVTDRIMLGIRWDFLDSQALTLEIADARARNASNDSDAFGELRLQWSAAFP